MPPTAPRLFVVLPQLPHDPSSGAARSVNTAAQFLAAAGWSVRVLGTLATETAAEDFKAVAQLQQLGLTPRREGKTWRFEQRGVAYTLLDTGRRFIGSWERTHGEDFDRLFDAALAEFRPDVVYTFGGMPAERKRQDRARAAGCKVVFALCNHSYYVPGFFDLFDAVTTTSEVHAEGYRRSLGLESTPLSTPIELADVLAPEREPIFFTVVNPSVEKGLYFVARLAEELGTRRPDLPLLIIEARGTGGMMVRAGLAGGFDLRRHGNVMFSPAVPRPRDIFVATRALLVPSVWQEPSGRVVGEALVNGVPPLVSDRGALEENCHGAGFVLPLPADLTMETRVPVAPAAVAPWLSVIERLADDAEFYETHSRRAREASRYFLPETMGPRYVAFFERVLAAPRRAVTPGV